MESIEETGIRSYVREKRLKALNTLMTMNGRYNEILKKPKEKREVIAKQRYDGKITLREYWDSRMSLEDRIQAVTERRDEVVKRIITILPKTQEDTSYRRAEPANPEIAIGKEPKTGKDIPNEVEVQEDTKVENTDDD